LWEELARADDTATFFQTPAWFAFAARRHPGAKAAPLLFEFPDGPACLPLLRDRRWGRDRYFSPFGTYAAVLCSRHLAAAERGEVESSLSSLNLQLTSSPFTRNPVSVGRALSAVSHFIDLRVTDPEDPARAWERDARRRARRAAEAGVVVRRVRHDEDRDWEAYKALYRGTVTRWGGRARSVHPPEFFDDLRAMLAPRPGFQFWVAESQGVIGAGFIGFDHNRHHALWHAAADGAFFGSGAVQLLYRTMIADAARRGLETFDLLGSGGLAGVEAFKASLGAREVRYESYLNRTGLVGALAGLRDLARGR
jgi:hypothetical protein